jgi:hypothetical protein
MTNTYKFNASYKDKCDSWLCNNQHFLYVYREAIRMDVVYGLGQFPLLYHARQLRCLPYRQTEAKLNTELLTACRENTIEQPTAINEKEEVAADN